MIDYFYLSLKVGDQILDHLQLNRGYKTGYFIDYIDPNVYSFTDSNFGNPHSTAHAILKLDYNHLELFKSLIIPEDFTSFDRYSNLYRNGSGYFVLEELEGLAGTPGLVESWKGSGTVDVIDLRGADYVSLIKYTKNLTMESFDPDNNVTTGGLQTIGSGGDWATYNVLDADMDTLTSDLTPRIISNVTEVATVNMQFQTAPFDVIFDSDDNHLGDVLGGWELSIAHSSHGLSIQPPSTSEVSIITYKDFSIKRTVAAANNNLYLLRSVLIGVLTKVKYRNMFLDGGGLAGSGVFAQQVAIEMDRLAVRDCNGSGYTGATANDFTRIMENSLFEGCGVGVDLTSRSNFTCRNVAAYNNGTDWLNISNAIGIETGASDATNTDANWNTSTNNNPSLTPGNEIELNDTIPGYASHLSGGTVSGAAPALSSVDMAGNAWDPQYPIGPKNVIAGADFPARVLRNRMNSSLLAR